MFLCSWAGIHCDNMNISVVSLDISNYNLSGIFPPEIHKLARVQYLNISNNGFSGNLSWEFAQLKELILLDAYNNNFNGSLPLGVTQFPS
ncbi:leucine-rich repeat receptor-like serine/threonine-protein kinase BAM3 [Prunus yedoensis var. nudiflora]|uniref:Leucine-rich repeat receptor-like serine/threonine-protein kinase BAM3 n=1 Tax=Prunus yedoensis var. nudiflora TaxID=2094558 RepID=A0A314Y0F0_PRUYE|nr:leucine-rich repeat receptor-like serine/threonine-protein kinase BAM3 [Prunus yedoensis var. nudiflora]